jgi:hypothetical protein
MSYKATINIVTDADKVFGNLGNVAIANAFRNIGNHFQGVAVGSISEAVTINSGPTLGTGTITVASGNMSNGDTVTINSVVLTGETGTPSGNGQFKVGSTAIKTAMALAACINANPSLNTLLRAVYSNGTSSSGVVTVTALGAGTTGNYTWSQSGSNVTLLPASAMGGGANGPVSASNVFTITASNLSAADTVTIGGTTFTAESSGAVGNQFNVGASALITGQNLAAAINAYSATSPNFVAVTTGTTTGIVTVTCLLPGTIGNNVSVSKSASNGSWSHSTFFAGGTDALIQTFHKGI